MSTGVDHEEDSTDGNASKTANSDLFQHTGTVSVVKGKNNTNMNENYYLGFHIGYSDRVCKEAIHLTEMVSKSNKHSNDVDSCS